MCTAIAKRGNDLLYGYNLDLDPAVWDYSLYRTKRYFTVGITVGKTTYFTHGVNRKGQFANLPYSNGAPFAPPKGAVRERIDLLADRWIRGRYSEEDVQRILQEKVLVYAPAATMHMLLGNGSGDMMILEPGYGIKPVTEDYAVLTNFPVLTELADYSNPFFGKDRYDRAVQVLSESGADFSVKDALHLLHELKQVGQWGTRVSFVYSRNENAVYYFRDGDIDHTEVHRFA